MKKIDTYTSDITEENIDRLIELFPSVATEIKCGGGQFKEPLILMLYVSC